MDAGTTSSNQLAGDGCGCRAPGRAGTSLSGLWALASFALLLASRRRR
jgi:MYXO-CTERM domain-containing protein